MATHLELPTKPFCQPSLAAQTVRWVFSFLGNLTMAAVFAAIIAATPMVIREFALIVWGIGLVVIVRRHLRQSERRLGTFALLVQLVAAGLVIAIAAAAPGKIKDEVLARPMVLPGKELTLAELQQHFELYGRRIDGTPTHISLSFSPDEGSTEIRFPAENLTLREFVTAIEAQSRLTGRFSSCGNGHTILRGEDCCFGLYFRDRRRPY